MRLLGKKLIINLESKRQRTFIPFSFSTIDSSKIIEEKLKKSYSNNIDWFNKNLDFVDF